MEKTKNLLSFTGRHVKTAHNKLTFKEEDTMIKRVKKLTMTALVFVMVLLNALSAFAASTDNRNQGYSVPATLTLKVGESKILNVTGPKGSTGSPCYQYASDLVKASNNKRFDSAGHAGITFTGLKAGNFDSYVHFYYPGTGKYNGISVKCRVTVLSKNATVATKIPLKNISLNKKAVTINKGSSISLSVSYNPTSTTEKRTILWSSNNTSVATVSSGKVIGKKAGSVTITAKVGSKTAICKVTVKAPSSSSSKPTHKTSGNNSKDSYKNVSDAYVLLNTFRTTRSNQWYWNSSNTVKSTTYGLKALVRDTALESTAKIRAKEQWIMYYEKGIITHNRPNGTSCYTVYPAGLKSKGENLAWGQTSSREVVLDPQNGWSETYEKYSGQGHRRNMLSSTFTKVGIACYVKNGKTCWAMCLGQ